MLLKACKVFLFILPGIFASGQVPYPAFPPADVSSQMDRDQMLWQMRITLPRLTSRALDPNRPAEAFPSDKNNTEGNWTNDKKYTYTRSAFGLWNNYSDRSAGFFPGPDSARLGDYTPIDLLRMHDGSVITKPEEWWSRRRPEIFADIKESLYGSIPPDSLLPRITWTVAERTGGRGSGAYREKELTGTIDISRYPQVRNRPVISATLRIPANASGRVPVVVIFGGFGNITDIYWERAYPAGWGICIFNLTKLQPDNGAGLTSYLIGLVNMGNWRKPGDWGTLVAWSWGVSRLIDYFETDRDVDAKAIGLSGHSRYGKATLVTMAYEPRVAIGFPSDAGSLGTKMNRRHWGQDLEHSTGANEYHWMAGNFFRWAGEKEPGHYLPRKIEDCPVDAHSLVALCAPRPLLVNGGTTSSWADPYGQYLSVREATPVYELLGKPGLVMPDPKPETDKAYIEGTLAYRYHNGGHTDAPEWPFFFQFANRHIKTAFLNISSPALVIDAGAGSNAYVTVSGSGAWKARSNRLWLKCMTRKSQGSDTLRIAARKNRKNARDARITVTGDGRRQDVFVYQAAMAPYVRTGNNELRASNKEGSKVSFNIESNSAWNISAGAGWIQSSAEAGSGSREVVVTLLANPTVGMRTGVITVTSPGIDPLFVKVNQEAGLPVINVSQDNISFPAEGGKSPTLVITSNTVWNLQMKEPWLNTNMTSGEGFRQLILTAAPNNGTETRTGTLLIKVEGLDPFKIKVVQRGR